MRDGGSRKARTAGALAHLLLAGCASAPLDRAGTLQSYDNLTTSNGLVTQSRLRVDEPVIRAAKTVQIVPTAFGAGTTGVPLTVEQRRLVANAVDRALCAGLSERFQVVGPTQPADLTVRAVVTHVTPTDPVAVGASRGAAIAKTILLPGIPVPVPRIPIGMGSLSLEAEARDLAGHQRAAMIWARGAGVLGGSGRMSVEGDAYGLASDFGSDFSKLLVTGSTPFGKLPSFPSAHGIRTSFGGAPSSPACEAFGRSPGVAGFMGGALGLPPGWTDKGAPAAPAP
nr:DUF3313 domain-containing protein [Phreatobacter stygius]